MKTGTIRNMYTMCTPITKHTLCTLRRNLCVHLLYTLNKVFKLGTLITFLKKVFNRCCRIKNSAHTLLFFLFQNSPIKINRLRLWRRGLSGTGERGKIPSFPGLILQLTDNQIGDFPISVIMLNSKT